MRQPVRGAGDSGEMILACEAGCEQIVTGTPQRLPPQTKAGGGSEPGLAAADRLLLVHDAALNLRWAVDGFDAMSWRGLGFGSAVMPMLVLLGFALAFATLAVWRFRWEE